MARTDPRPNYGSYRRVRGDGYVDIYEPNHPLARNDGYVFEHRKMAWDAGLLTDPKLQVHHVNEIKNDNRLDNFEIKSCPGHALDHVEERGWVINQHGVWPVKPREKRVNAPRPIRSCLHCGNMISLNLRRDASYCDERCRTAAFRAKRPGQRRQERVPRACAYCGEMISLTKQARAIYCSQRCNEAACRKRKRVA